MAAQSFSIEIKTITLYKFGTLKYGMITPDVDMAIDIKPQVHEVIVYESIFEPIMRAELAVIDYIGLFNNFPLTGEEICIVEYVNVGDDTIRRWYFATTDITDITPDPKNRAQQYMIRLCSIEGLANILGTVQKGYRDTPIQISKKIFQEHIIDRVEKVFPGYKGDNIFAEDNETKPQTIVIPNMHPLAAIDMVNSYAVSEVSDKYSYCFYQNANGFNFKTIQSMINNSTAQTRAINNKYVFLSDEISEERSEMNNKQRLISNLTINKRQSSMQKVATGYFNNNLFEINIAQKAFFTTRTTNDQINTIRPNPLNTKAYSDWAKSYNEGDEQSNRTRYVVTTRAEANQEFPLYQHRLKWGKDLASKIALNQIDLTVVIPGTNTFAAGDLFYMEMPEFHGFSDIKADDLISGYFLITEIKQIIRIGGYQSTVMRINKDSYNTSIDRPSQYGSQST